MSEAAIIDTPQPVSETQQALDTMTPRERQQWRETGAVPDASPAPESLTDSASSPDQPAAQALSTDSHDSPASEPGTPKKGNAETRKAELQAEIKALLAQRDELKRNPTPAASPVPDRPAAPSDVTAASSPAGPRSLHDEVTSPDVTAPMLSEEDFFARYPEARYGGDYNRYIARYEIRAERMEAQREAQWTQKATSFTERVGQALQADPSFRDILNTTGNELKPLERLEAGESPRGLNYAATEILVSPQAVPILRHLSADPSAMQDLRRSTPEQAIRMIAKLEARFESASVPSQPVVKTTTSAPAPHETLGRKPTIPVNDADAALAAGDVRGYILAKNRQESAS